MAVRRITKVLVLGLAICGCALVTAETVHHHRFGHFVGYGLHTDVIVANSAIGTYDTYVARIWNISIKTLDIEGCRLPGGYAGEGIIYRWDIQKWEQSGKRWVSLRGADTWVPKPFGGYDNEEPCRPEMTPVRPLQSLRAGWVYKDWVTTGESIRVAIHTSATSPPEKQQIVYTSMFVVKHP
jgi:hypothetical protein